MAANDEIGPHRQSQILRDRDDLQLILDTIPEFVFYKDTQNNMLRVNRAAAESLGVTPSEMANEPTRKWYPDLADQYFEDDRKVIESGQPRTGIVETIRAGDGELRSIETDKFPLKDELGQVIGVLVVARDITDRKRLEDTLHQSQRLESVGRLAGGVAHDFNNLLTAMLGHVEIAEDEAPAASPLLDNLAAVRLAIRRAADLTAQLLAFARQQVHQPRVVDLRQVVLDARLILQRVIEESIEFTIVSPAEPVMACVDPGQISQVIINMAINARDAMPRGGTLTIETRLEVVEAERRLSLPEGSYAVITITDTGSGISESEQRQIFEPFFTSKERGTGTGLGLATAYGIVQQHAGDILVDSTQGVGTAFRVYLPHDARTSQAVSSAEGKVRTHGSGESILFVEDDPSLRTLGAAVLRRNGYSVLIACDGEDALRVAHQNNHAFDLLVTDVIMPKLSGPLLVKRLRETLPDLKVLYMSGYAEAGLVGEGSLDLGTDLLAKPFAREDLLARVSRKLMPS